MENYVSDKIRVIEDFYDTKVKSFGEGIFGGGLSLFLTEGFIVEHPKKLYKFLFKDNSDVSWDDFINAMLEGNWKEYPDIYIASIEALFPHVKEEYMNGLNRPKKELVEIWEILHRSWDCMSEVVHKDSPVAHLKFHIISKFCMGSRKSITSIGLSKDRQHLFKILETLAEEPCLLEKRNELEKRSGVNRGTMNRLKPQLQEFTINKNFQRFFHTIKKYSQTSSK